MKLSKFEMDGQEIEVIDRTARNKADSATVIANDAKQTAETAQNEAINAQKTSNNASNIATNAFTKADSASTNAKNAETVANRAEENASNALSIGTDAKTTANGAQTTADNATVIANQAKQLAESNVSDVMLTNENGVYTIKQTKNGTETEVGTIETSKSNNPLVEIKDSVVTNDLKGYDFHTFTETTEDGTENEVGKFYMAQKQITGASISGSSLVLNTVDQSGTEGSESIELPASGSSSVKLSEFTESTSLSGYIGADCEVTVGYYVSVSNLSQILGFYVAKKFDNIESVNIQTTSNGIVLYVKYITSTRSNTADCIIYILHNSDINPTIDGSYIVGANIGSGLECDSDALTYTEDHEAGTLAKIPTITFTLNYSYKQGTRYNLIAQNNADMIILGYDEITMGYNNKLYITNAVVFFKNTVKSGNSYSFIARFIS